MKDLNWLLDIPIAHRGYHSPGIPENSMAAFCEAVRNGYSIELDVHKTKDDLLVVFHDDNLVRLTSYDKIIEDCAYSEIRALVLENTKERIPLLSDVLDGVRGKAGLLIEIKTHPGIGRAEELVCRMLDRYSGKFAIVSFDPRILRWFYKNRPEYIRGQISGGLTGKKLPFFQRFLLKYLVVSLISRPDVICYEFPYLSAWAEFVAWIFRAPLIVWPVRDPLTAGKVREHGWNCIFEGFHYRK
jgi:glycerophosphoryl diester phosphodiesterase